MIQRSILPRLINLAVNVGVTFILALLGWGIWSLVIGYLLSTFVYTFLIWFSLRGVINIRLTLNHSKSLLWAGKNLFFLNIFGLFSQSDIGIVSAILSPLQIGYYSMVANYIVKPSGSLRWQLCV